MAVFTSLSFFFWGIPPTTTCDLNLHLHCQSHGLLDFHLISTMSYIHRVVNVLLRGLVIYAVLGLECSYSNDLPSRSSDAQNVATTGKRSPCRTQVSLIYLRMYSVTPPHSPLPSLCLPLGKPRNALRSSLMEVMHLMSTVTSLSLSLFLFFEFLSFLFIADECVT